MTSRRTNASCRPLAAVGAVLAALALLLAPLAVAAPVPPADEGLTVLHLSESADRAIRRDRLHVQLRVETTGGNAKQVQSEINRRMTSALVKVKTAAGVKSETGSYSV